VRQASALTRLPRLLLQGEEGADTGCRFPGTCLARSQDPGSQPHRRVVQPVSQGLRPGLLEQVVATLLLLPASLERGEDLLCLRERLDVGADDRGWEGRHQGVDSAQAVRAVNRHPSRDHGPDVVAVGAKALMAEPVYQPHPECGHTAPRHAAPRGPIRAAEAGHGGDDHVEGVRRIASMVSRVGQEQDELEHLDEGARPAMRDEERQRGGTMATCVDAVDAETVDMSAEVREHVYRVLPAPAVEVRVPVRHERLYVGEVRAIIPAGVLDLIGPARAGQAFLQVVEHWLRDVNDERLALHLVSFREHLGVSHRG
jgi:hypothetical protein